MQELGVEPGWEALDALMAASQRDGAVDAQTFALWMEGSKSAQRAEAPPPMGAVGPGGAGSTSFDWQQRDESDEMGSTSSSGRD